MAFDEFAYVVGLIWSLIWFLISGWVSTLLQIAVLIAVIYWLKYGWQRAPYEVWKRTRSFGRFFWSWIRGRDPEPRAHDEVVRLVKLREFGDINVSTLLSLAALVGLLLVAPLRHRDVRLAEIADLAVAANWAMVCSGVRSEGQAKP